MKQESFTTPILFLIFNRPDTTERVFQQIRAIKPKQLFVSADGPRPHKIGEAEQCAQARAIIKQVDWDCELQTKFSDTNQGCKIGVSSAVSWFFEHVEEGIILEDDCLPDLSFFKFCQELLPRYRTDERVMHIGGANFQNKIVRGKGGYYFSQLPHVWGWATWKRAWALYDVAISSFSQLLQDDRMQSLFFDDRLNKYWKKRFNLAYQNQIDTWDIQWQYALLTHHGLSIIPNVNLVSNIGFFENATHTRNRYNPLANLPTQTMTKIVHPQFVVPDSTADVYSFQKYFYPTKPKKLYYLITDRLRNLSIVKNKFTA